MRLCIVRALCALRAQGGLFSVTAAVLLLPLLLRLRLRLLLPLPLANAACCCCCCCCCCRYCCCWYWSGCRVFSRLLVSRSHVWPCGAVRCLNHLLSTWLASASCECAGRRDETDQGWRGDGAVPVGPHQVSVDHAVQGIKHQTANHAGCSC